MCQSARAKDLLQFRSRQRFVALQLSKFRASEIRLPSKTTGLPKYASDVQQYQQAALRHGADHPETIEKMKLMDEAVRRGRRNNSSFDNFSLNQEIKALAKKLLRQNNMRFK